MERAALDYIEGLYEGDSTKLEDALRRDLWKYGFISWQQHIQMPNDCQVF